MLLEPLAGVIRVETVLAVYAEREDGFGHCIAQLL